MASCKRQQKISPSLQLPATATPVPTVLPATATLSPTVTPTSPQVVPDTTATLPAVGTTTSERLCSDDDFNSAASSPGMGDPETLVGFRPLRDWPSESDWQFVYGLLLLGTDYSISGYRYGDQHLVLLKKRICRYGEKGRYALSEIADYILLSDLQADEVVIVSPEIILFQSDTVSKRIEYQIEIFLEAECNDISNNAIVRGKYDAVSLPDKIEPGYQLPIRILHEWYPDPNAGEFRSVRTDGVSCEVHVHGK